jgi:hypothetical protein
MAWASKSDGKPAALHTLRERESEKAVQVDISRGALIAAFPWRDFSFFAPISKFRAKDRPDRIASGF